MLTAERLRELLAYDSETGVFTRLKDRPDGRHKVGEIAGCSSRGYVKIRVDDELYAAHRLAVLWMTGEWPTDLVDHVDGDGTNNRWANLRQASRQINNQNRRRTGSKRPGALLGAFPSGNRFYSKIFVEGKIMRLGTFSTAEEAHAAYVKAKRIHHEGGTL